MEPSSQDTCYMCLQEENVMPIGPDYKFYGKFYKHYLCECKGSIKIHWSCLFDLLSQPEKPTICGICKEPYHVYFKPNSFKYNGFLYSRVLYRKLPHQWRKYYSTGGLLLAEGSYINGMNGIWNLYFQNNHIDQMDTIKDTVQQRGKFKDGIKDGEWTELEAHYYNTSKTIEGKGTYVNGKREGHWTYRIKETGVLHEEGPYINGQKKGHWKHYYDSGILEKEGDYDTLYQIGWWKYYSPLGHLLREQNCDKYESKDYYRSGKLHKHYFHDIDNNIYMKSYYESGADKETVPYKGRGTTLYPNGKLKEEIMYDGESYPKKVGTYKLYSKTGIILIECEYNQNKHGPYKAYYESGKLKEEGSYFTKRCNANKHGLWKTFDESGKLITEETYDNGKIVLPRSVVAEPRIAGKKRKRE